MWDQEVDLLVVGSGAAGMSAGIRAHDLGAEVLIIEKSDRYGGSTAMSGGVCWVANNPGMASKGIDDSFDEGLVYLKTITAGEVPEEKLVTYLEGSLKVMSYFEEKTHVCFDPMEKYTDYYPETEGGKPGGRSMDARPFDGTSLGEEFHRLRRPHPQSQIMGKFGISAAQAQEFLVNTWRTKFLMLWLFLRYALRFVSRRKYGRDTRLTAGNALIARLRLSLADRGVPLWLECGATGLIVEDGRVVGAEIDKNGKTLRIGARKGVLLAAGGFERNLKMRQQWQQAPITDTWSAANLHNVGEGIQMGMDAGGAVELMDEAWWTPTTTIPRQELAWVLVVEKNLPGSIFVNKDARRFTNEAAPYIDVVHGMYKDGHDPHWMVFDADFRHKYPCGPVAPGYAVPDSRTPRKLTQDFMRRSKTLEELAAKLDLDPAALKETVERFNEHAREGHDPDHRRGESLSDRYYGDPRVKPNPCLAPIDKAPFYAIPVFPGDLGTKGGLRTDTKARVLSESGDVLPGLYAAGNCASALMGRTYPGAGGTIGPALTFGFLAAEDACG